MAEVYLLPRKADVSQLESSLAGFRALLDTMKSGETLTIDGSRLDQVDSAFGQLLLAVLRTCQKKGIKVLYGGLDPNLLFQTAFACDHLDPEILELVQ